MSIIKRFASEDYVNNIQSELSGEITKLTNEIEQVVVSTIYDEATGDLTIKSSQLTYDEETGNLNI